MDLRTELVQLREKLQAEQAEDVQAISKAAAVRASTEARVERRTAELNKLDAIINSLQDGPGGNPNA